MRDEKNSDRGKGSIPPLQNSKLVRVHAIKDSASVRVVSYVRVILDVVEDERLSMVDRDGKKTMIS